MIVTIFGVRVNIDLEKPGPKILTTILPVSIKPGWQRHKEAAIGEQWAHRIPCALGSYLFQTVLVPHLNDKGIDYAQTPHRHENRVKPVIIVNNITLVNIGANICQNLFVGDWQASLYPVLLSSRSDQMN